MCTATSSFPCSASGQAPCLVKLAFVCFATAVFVSARELQRCRVLVTRNVDLPAKLRAILNSQHGSGQMAVDDGAFPYDDPSGRDECTGDVTADDDGIGKHVGVDVTGIVNGERMALKGDGAVDAPGNRERLVSGDVASDRDGGSDNRS